MILGTNNHKDLYYSAFIYLFRKNKKAWREEVRKGLILI